MAGEGLQSTLSPVNLHSTTVCDVYTCADDVLCYGVLTLKCHTQHDPEGGSKEIKEESCHHSRQAQTAIECILARMEMLFMCHLKLCSLPYSPVELGVSCAIVTHVMSLLSQSLKWQ